MKKTNKRKEFKHFDLDDRVQVEIHYSQGKSLAFCPWGMLAFFCVPQGLSAGLM